MKLVMILLSSIFSIFFMLGCASKEQIVFKDRFVCFEMVLLGKDENENIEIRIHKDDKDLFIAKKEQLESKFLFYEAQITNYLDSCKKILNIKDI